MNALYAMVVKPHWLSGLLVGLFAMTILVPDIPAQVPVQLSQLTNARQIRELSPEEARKGHPVKLRGVVTFCDEKAYKALFIQDTTAGIHVKLAPGLRAAVGQELELVGSSGAGEFAPIVEATELRIIGTSKLPPPTLVSFEDLATGVEDSQWVEVRGVVRSATPSTLDRTQLELYLNGQRLEALVTHLDPEEAAHLVNATIRMRGVCYVRFNQKRQLRAPWLGVTSFADIVVEQPSPGDPAEVPVTSLLQFNSDARYARRVKVQGVVTLQQEGNSIFIQDQGHGLCVKTRQPTIAVPGDRIEVIGFPALGQYAPILEDATFRRIGSEPPPAPIPVDVSQLLSDDYDGELIRVRARLMNSVQRPDEQVLVFQAGELIFNAHLEKSKAGNRLNALKSGSELELTGVCILQPMENWAPSLRTRPGGFRLLLRSADDLIVIKNPPWWTLARLLWMTAIMGLILLAGLAWVVVLDRRVREQTQIIQQKIQREAVLEERSRIAREFHDTLEQELAAITIQLDIVTAKFEDAPQVARQQLDLARNMSRRSLSEARRSVWDLRSHLLENSNLVMALSEVAKPLAASSHVEIIVKTSGAPRKLTVRAENNILRIAQEAITNALKHARATRINVDLNYEAETIRLRICDNGVGFDTHNPLGISGGHFGLLDMSERAEKLGGSLQVRSAEGKGTEIVLEVVDKLLHEATAGPGRDSESEPSHGHVA